MHINDASQDPNKDIAKDAATADALPVPEGPKPNSTELESAQTTTNVTYQALSWQGPLPPPSILAEFDQVIDNGAERLFRMGEKEQDNRLENDRVDRENIQRIVNGQERRLNLGQVTSSSIALAAVLAGVIMVSQGRPLEGGGFIAGTAAVIKYLRWDGKSDNDRFEMPDESDGDSK
jgi:uncharacterized membrane protein